MTASGDDADAIPPEVLDEFGSEKARPKVTKVYRPPWGLRKFKPHVLFTRATAARLRQRGVLEVELRWRWVRRYVSLLPGYWFVYARPSAQRRSEARSRLAEQQHDERNRAA